MCLGVPAKVIEVRGKTAVVDYGGVRREVDILLVPDLRPGDYVIVHAGAAIARIDEKEALETLRLWAEVLEALKPEAEVVEEGAEEETSFS
ncbi:MAG: HypC/HybG/HupF family hydrogenase formation chaperone [Thermoprotei archaeon]|nr:MAG: HypC/HybG/HupF family hydrogenase formation chaperone [Thermoprotei archaeon]